MDSDCYMDQLTELRGRFNTATICLTAAAKYCGIDPRTLMADKTFPLKQLGRRYAVSLVGLAKWLAK